MSNMYVPHLKGSGQGSFIFRRNREDVEDWSVLRRSSAVASALCFVLFNRLVDWKLRNDHLVVTDKGSASCDKEMNQ